MKRHFFSNASGIVATEFALMAPVLLLLFLGGFEVTRFILLQQKTEKVAYTIGDVVTQNTTITNAQLAQIVTAASQIMQPYTFGANGVVIVSSVYQTGTVNPPTVRWRYTGGGTLARTSTVGNVNGNATLPAGLTLNDKDNVIIAEVYYRYSPMFSGGVVGTQDIYKSTVFKPRLGALTTPPT
jgi:Flp pilus assembly protein TadG